MSDQWDSSRQSDRRYIQQYASRNPYDSPASQNVMPTPYNAADVSNSRGKKYPELPSAQPDRTAPFHGREILQNGPSRYQPDRSKPIEQPGWVSAGRERLGFSEWKTTQFLPPQMREPSQSQPRPAFPPPIATQRYGETKAPTRQPPPESQASFWDQSPPIGAGAVRKHAVETLRVCTETYTIATTLQAARSDGSAMSQGVFLVHDKEKRRFVAKRLSVSTQSQRERAFTEVQALKRITSAVQNHENLNMLRAFDFPEKAPSGTLILEYCDGGSLAAGINALKRQSRGGLTEDLAFHLFYGIAKGLAMLHHGFPNHTNPTTHIRDWKTICHLDIKPANILLDHRPIPGKDIRLPRVIIADFGCAVTSDDMQHGRESKVVSENGTPGWSPPKEPSFSTRKYGKPTDIWQTGGVIQAMCLLLFTPDMARIQMPVGKRYGLELNCLVATCMSADYARRPTAMDLCGELRKVMVRKGYRV